MEMWVNPRRVPDPFQKVLRHVDRMTLEELPMVGLNLWHKFDERSGKFAMNAAWKE